MEKPVDSIYKLYIGGKWLDGKERKTFNSYCPANDEYLVTYVNSGKEDVDLAVDVAWKALKDWKDISIKEKADMFLKIADLIDINLEKLAMVETLDTGKPIRETRSVDIPLISDYFRYFASQIRIKEEAVTLENGVWHRESIGVVGEIISWDIPLSMLAYNIVSLVSEGNCLIIKPYAGSSLAVLELAKILDVILPAGVVNIITGKDATIEKYLTEYAELCKDKKISLQHLFSENLEFTGKSLNIYFNDCLLKNAMKGLAVGTLLNLNWVHCQKNRIFVQEEIYSQFIDEAIKIFNNVKVGLPWEKATQIGAQMNENDVEDALKYIELAEEEGARVACGGYRIADEVLEEGYFLKPTLLVDVTCDMKVNQKEILGPVAVVTKFKDEAELIEMIKDRNYRLGGSIWSENIDRVTSLISKLKGGEMCVNHYKKFWPHVD